jgi:hypothetical protein
MSCPASADAAPQPLTSSATTTTAPDATTTSPARAREVHAGSRVSLSTASLSAAAAASAAFVAARLGLCDQLRSAQAKTPGVAMLRDGEGRTCLHYAAGFGHEVR